VSGDGVLVSAGPADDEAIRALLRRLARPHSSGGEVVERAALLAEGTKFPAIIAWITDHAGVPEASPVTRSSQGLHGSRMSGGGATGPLTPLRYVLPAGTLL
jgi:hypothetical protein